MPASRNTHPEVIVDKNGKVTTVHKSTAPHTPAIAKASPSVKSPKAITGAERERSTTATQQAIFSAATLIIRSAKPDAKTVNVFESDGRLFISNTGGFTLEDNLDTFAAELALNESGIGEGVYKLPSVSTDEKTRAKRIATILSARSIQQSNDDYWTPYGLNQDSASVILFAATNSTDPDVLDEIASSVNEMNIQNEVAGNPNTSPATMPRLADSPHPAVRGRVGEMTTDRALMEKLSIDDDNAVLSRLVKNPKLPSDLLTAVYERSSSSAVRSIIVGRRDCPPELVEDALRTSYSANVISSAKSVGGSVQTDTYSNNIPQAMVGENEAVDRSKSAAEFVRSMGFGSEGKSEYILDDETARSVAWRVSSRLSASKYPAINSLNNGDDFSPQLMVEEAASIVTTHPHEFPWGFRNNGATFANALLGWARSKQV